MKTTFEHISDLFASEDENNQELAFLLLSNYECPRWLALQIGFQYLHSNRPEYAETFINQYFVAEAERENMWAATRFFYFPEWKTVWHSENIFSSSEGSVQHWAQNFILFLPDYEQLCAYRSEFLTHFARSVSIAYWFYQLPEAELLLQTAIKWNCQEPDLYFYLGELYLKNQQFEQAETHLLAYLERVPDQVNDNYYKLDEYYHDQYRYFPDTLQAYNLLVSLYADFQPFRNVEKALEYAQKGIEFAPNHYQSPYLRYAELLGENPDFPRAEILYLYKQYIRNQELIFSTNKKDTYFFLRLSLYRAQKKNNAVIYDKMLQIAVELNNCNEILHACKMSQNWEKQLVTVIEKKGDYWQAEVLIEKILKKNPRNATALYWKPIVEDKIYRLK